jgi:hypothetical protein
MYKKLSSIFVAAPFLLSACGANLGGGGSSQSQAELTVLAGVVESNGHVDGTGSAARFTGPLGLSVDANSNVLMVDQQCVRKVSPAGVVTTIAGACGLIADYKDGQGLEARFSSAYATAADSAGNVYVADFGIRKISPTALVSSLPDTGAPRQWDGHGPTFGTPYRSVDVVVDTTGNLYAVYTGPNPVIRKISPTGELSLLAGSLDKVGSSDGTGANASFSMPGALAIDGANNIYVVDGNVVRKITPAGVVTTLAGKFGESGSTDGTGAAARFQGIGALAVDKQGTVYVADDGGKLIRKVTPAGVVTTIIGIVGSSGPGQKLLPAGAGPGSAFLRVYDMTIDANGLLYIGYGGALLKIKLAS